MIITQDSFTDTSGTDLASHTGEVGATWTRHPSWSSVTSAAISDANRVRLNAVEGSPFQAAIYYSSGVPAGTDVDLECDLRVVSSVFLHIMTINACIQTGAKTHYEIGYYVYDGAWEIGRFENGVGTSLGTYVMALSVGTTYHLKGRVLNGTVLLYVDGILRINGVDGSPLPAGRTGLTVYGQVPGTNTTGMHLDNFLSYDAPESVPLLSAWGPGLDVVGGTRRGTIASGMGPDV